MSLDTLAARATMEDGQESTHLETANLLYAACDEIDSLRAKLAEVEKERGVWTEQHAQQHRVNNELAKRAEAAEAREAILREALESVYERIAHGDVEHRAWLKAKMDEIVRAALESA